MKRNRISNKGSEKTSLNHATIYSLCEARTFFVKASLVARVKAAINESTTQEYSIP